MEEKEIIYNNVPLVEEQDEVTVDEVMPIIEVTEMESYDIEMLEAFPAPQNDNSYNHALLNNREINDAHPISAITGLRAELNTIEALKTVYSDKKGNADYYAWANGNLVDGVGYFVTLNKDVQTIDICTGDDIFGVVVDSAAFIGGQDDVARDGHYGLVATSGAVHVRCELDVAEGDYVVSNPYGIATKSSSNRGYRVVALHDIGGVPHATIQLNITADQISSMGAELQDLDSRMDAAETNIVSAINVANQAYQKATEIDISNQEISGKVDNALGIVDKLDGDVANMGEQVSNSALISAQAKAIAESAATSAESMKNEAVEKANEALTETSKLRKDFEAKIEEIDIKLENSALELEKTKESITSTKDELQGSIDDAVKDLEELKKDLEPLATWPEGSDAEDATGVAGFVARADEDSATLASIVTWKGDAGDSLAGFVQDATEENATVKAVASYKRKDANGNVIEPGGAAGLIAQVDANQAVVQTVAALDGGIAGLEAKVKDNTSYLTLLASQTIGDYIAVETWSETDKDTSKIYYTKDTKDYYYYKNNKWNQTKNTHDAGLDGAIAGVQSVADANKAQFDAMAAYDTSDGTKSALAGMTAYVDANSANFSELAKYSNKDSGNSGIAGLVADVDNNTSELNAVVNHEFTKNDNTVVTGLAGLNAYVNENESNISLVANRVAGKYTIIPELVTENKRDISKIYGTYDGETEITTYWYYTNRWNSTAEWASVPSRDTNIIYYVSASKQYLYYDNNVWKNTEDAYTAGLPSAIAGVQVETDDNSSSINSLTSWQGATNIAMVRIEQKADANGAYIQSTVSNMDKYSVGPHSQAYGFTLEQAASVLEEGMIYVPANKIPTDMGAIEEEYKLASEAIVWIDDDKDITKVYYKLVGTGDTQTKQYWYFGYDTANKKYDWISAADDKIPTAKRTFMPTYLYKWGRVGGGLGPYGWITVDKFYIDTDKTNTSAPAVYFQHHDAPSVVDGDKYGYWYTNGATLTGTAVDYESYTLYKWDLPYKYQAKKDDGTITDVEEYHWVAVATLAGNSSNRAVSQIRQDANSIELRVTNAEGAYAGIKTDLSGTQSTVQQLSKYANNGATIKTEANEPGSAVTIQSYTEADDGTITKQASLVLNVVKDVNGNPTSALSVDADYINFEGFTTFARPDDIPKNTSQLVNDSGLAYTNDIPTENDITTIVGGVVTTDYVNALNITATALHADTVITVGNLPSDVAMSSDIPTESDITTITENTIKTATIEASQVNVNDDLNAFGATIGGWTIEDDEIKSESGSVGMCSGDKYYLSDIGDSPVRYYAGLQFDETTENENRTISVSSSANGAFSETITPNGNVSSISSVTALYYQRDIVRQNALTTTVNNNKLITGTVDMSEFLADGEEITKAAAHVYIGGEDMGYYGMTVNGRTISVYAAIDTNVGAVAIIHVNVTVRAELLRFNYSIDNTVGSVSIFGRIAAKQQQVDLYIKFTYTMHTPKDPSFAICDDGTLYASSAKITGEINAPTGSIGGFVIQDGKLQSEDYNKKVDHITTGVSDLTYAEGLEYTFVTSGAYYKVSGIGSFQGDILIIPPAYEGYPVRSIGEDAFNATRSDINKQLITVVIPDSITNIGARAFQGCESLTNLTIGNSVKSIYDAAFSGCTGLMSIRIPDSVTYLGGGVFPYGIKDIVFSKYSQLKTLNSNTFQNCGFDSFTLPAMVEEIGEFVFNYCEQLTTLILHPNITTINIEAFDNCTSLERICYQGTYEDWASKGLDQEYVYASTANPAIYYYYGENPVTPLHNYWTYNTSDGICISNGETLIDTQYFTLFADGQMVAENAIIKGELYADHMGAQTIVAIDSKQQAHMGVTAEIPYYKSATETGTLRFVNGILVEVI